MRISDWSSDVCSSDLFEAPADRMLARAARAAEVAEAFIAQIGALIDAERPIDDERRGRHAIVERGRIDEGLDRRARLAFGLGGRKSGVVGKRVAVRGKLGWGRRIKKK